MMGGFGLFLEPVGRPLSLLDTSLPPPTYNSVFPIGSRESGGGRGGGVVVAIPHLAVAKTTVVAEVVIFGVLLEVGGLK
ncbi:hypothetical protein NL676_017282 [Syzygium grande]|nr:hypothetical protein NL676_017282 [Syzygium grande]